MKSINHQDILKALPKARTMIAPAMDELDSLEELNGHITFEDVVNAVEENVIPKEMDEALFEACKRVIESKRCITITEPGKSLKK